MGLSDIFVSKKHSRIPVYSETIDNIKGILYAKDVLPLLYEKQARKTLDILKLSREPLFVPESKKVEDLLKEFQEKKTRIAVVVDEYGGTAGLGDLSECRQGDRRRDFGRACSLRIKSAQTERTFLPVQRKHRHRRGFRKTRRSTFYG